MTKARLHQQDLNISQTSLLVAKKEKSINEKEILAVVEEEGNTWMTPICEYLTEEILPADKKKARAVRRKAARFGLPGEIVSDNGKQFRDNPFKDWCKKLFLDGERSRRSTCFTTQALVKEQGVRKLSPSSASEGLQHASSLLQHENEHSAKRRTKKSPQRWPYHQNDGWGWKASQDTVKGEQLTGGQLRVRPG
ncbi:reverse transcriptase domain-containing protein [Tanacetum coccineum]